MKLPRKFDDLQVTVVGDELLVYNPRTNLAHCLNSTATRVFHLCDGETSWSAAIERLGGDEHSGELLQVSLRLLNDKELLIPLAMDTISRRTFIERWGRAVAVLPVVATILTPKPAAAMST